MFGLEVSKTRIKCNQFYRFKAFQAAFLAKNLLLPSVSIFNINKIDYKIKKSTKAHVITSSMFSKNLTASNITMFEDFNVNQMGIDKINAQ